MVRFVVKIDNELVEKVGTVVREYDSSEAKIKKLGNVGHKVRGMFFIIRCHTTGHEYEKTKKACRFLTPSKGSTGTTE